jgi:drug/metabolite transporter (DMT)-like permease
MRRLWNAPYLLVATAALFWAGNSVVGRAVGDAVPPVALAFWRWSIAAGIAILAAPRMRAEWPVVRAHVGTLALLAALGIAGFAVLLYWGLQHTTAINSLLMQSAQPALILGLGFLMFGERPAPLRIVGVLLTLGGVAAIVSRGSPGALAALRINPGDAIILVATLLYSLYAVLLRRAPALHPMSFAAATFALGALITLPAYVAELASGARIEPGAPAALAIAYTAVLPSFAAYIAFNRGVELIGAARAGALLNLMPVFGAGLSMLFLDERLEAFHLAGVALIGLGLLLASRKDA